MYATRKLNRHCVSLPIDRISESFTFSVLNGALRYRYVWTEKLYLQYSVSKSDFMSDFFAYFQDTTKTSPKFAEGWMFDRGIAIYEAWKKMNKNVAPEGQKPFWVRSFLYINITMPANLSYVYDSNRLPLYSSNSELD